MENKDVFISYSRKDTEVANKICEAFDRAGITYFIDRQGIVGGMEFPEVLSKAICNCRLVLYLASNNSYASKFANKEILYAFLKKPSNSLLPYIIDNSSLPDKMEFMFADINWRNTIDHPIDTTLVDDICCLLGRERKSITTSPAPSATENAEELYKRGREYYDKGDYTSAVPLLSKAAAMGDADAQCNLGFCYDLGCGVNRDYSEAVKWYRKSAEQGLARAQYHLGLYYENGHSVNQDYVEAVRWYRKSAEQGDADAQCNLGFCYINGHGVNRDYREAFRWWRKSAEQGNNQAQRGLKIWKELLGYS